MKTLILAAVSILAISCSQSPTPTASRTPSAASPTAASPSAAPQHTSYAVIVKDFLEGIGPNYTLSIVASDGHVVALATARKRTTPSVQVGNLSTSVGTVYYLDGDSDVHFLRPDSSTGVATHITLASNQAAAFAVSPDDSRIAVSVLDFTRYPVGTRLYVEDLHGGANHVELFSSTSVEEWPVGWHAGHLVMALGINVHPQNAGDWFQLGHGYHVADAQTGDRLLSICDGKDSLSPESPAGTVCGDYLTGSVVSWDGVSRVLPKALMPDSTSGVCSLLGPLSPAGVVATATASVARGGCTSAPAIFSVTAQGQVDSRPLVANAYPIGWTDKDHLVVNVNATSSSPGLAIVNVNSLSVAPIQTVGFFAAALPGGL